MRRKPDYTIPSATEDRRAELGFDRLFLRPPSPTAGTLDALAEKLKTNRSIATAYAIRMAFEAVELMTKAELKEAIDFVDDIQTKKHSP